MSSVARSEFALSDQTRQNIQIEKESSTPKMTMLISFALAIIGIVATAGAWHHGVTALAYTSYGVGVTRYFFQMFRSDLKVKNCIFEIITAIGLVIGAALTLQGTLPINQLGFIMGGIALLQVMFDSCAIRELGKQKNNNS